MSRALDKDVAASLETSDKAEALAAFKAISGALTQPPPPPPLEGHEGRGNNSNDLLEIELLGRSHPAPAGCHVLQDGNAIAVPKLSLVRAFIVARMRLMAWRQQQDATAEDDDSDAVAATAVQLLMDPEHLTAANTRKRLLLRRAANSGTLADAVRDELRLVDSLLTSRLHRHTKSPTLWSHRHWLVQMCASAEWAPSLLQRSPRVIEDVHGALRDVVMVSAERHPRNYYAWCHARFLVGSLLSPPLHRVGDGDDDALETIVDSVKRWAFSHHTDVSGWSFLWFLLQPPKSTPEEAEARRRRAMAVVSEAAELAVSLRWSNESVWTFVRTAAASGLLAPDPTSPDANRFSSLCEQFKASLAQDSPGLETIRRAEVWARDFGICDPAVVKVP